MRYLRYAANILLLPVFFTNLALLLVAIAAPYISPHFFWPPAVVALFFKVFLLIHFFFLTLFLLLRREKLSIIASAVFLLSFPALLRNFAVHLGPTAKIERPYRLMTYNVHSFGWLERKEELARIFENIRTERPDVLCIQEYFIHPKKHKQIMGFLKHDMGLNYYYEYVTDVLARNNQVGLAIFSKYPFRNFTPIPFENSSNGAFYADIMLGGETLRVINAHFQSVALAPREYTLPGQEIDHVPRGRLTRISLHKFRLAFRKRSLQAEQVKEVAESSSYKVILCGDFNDTPTSYLYDQLTRHLDDTFLKTNTGTGTTFAGNIPGLRIDYILADPGIPISKTFVVHKKAGDHYPVVCDFGTTLSP